jgi:hypothetical protein
MTPPSIVQPTSSNIFVATTPWIQLCKFWSKHSSVSDTAVLWLFLKGISIEKPMYSRQAKCPTFYQKISHKKWGEGCYLTIILCTAMSLTLLYTKLAISKIEHLRESEALIKKAQGELFDGKKTEVENLVSGSL